MQPHECIAAVARKAAVKHKIKVTLELPKVLAIVGDNAIDKLLVSRFGWRKGAVGQGNGGNTIIYGHFACFDTRSCLSS